MVTCPQTIADTSTEVVNTGLVSGSDSSLFDSDGTSFSEDRTLF
jgi:hypothetical protein